MRSVTVITLLATAAVLGAEDSTDKLVDKLVEIVFSLELRPLPTDYTELDEIAIGKPDHTLVHHAGLHDLALGKPRHSVVPARSRHTSPRLGNGLDFCWEPIFYSHMEVHKIRRKQGPALVVRAALDEQKLDASSSSPSGDHDILVRAARGETVERTPVWLMRQAGRYMAAFREYSEKYPFRKRSETPEIATELSLQCHRAYGMDGIIMFSDILTPLPTLGIDFDVVKGKGPVISTKVRTEADVASMPDPMTIDFDEKLPFIRTTLNTLSKEAKQADTSLIGFVGAPFTLAAYTIEGKSDKHCLETKKMMMSDEVGTNKAMSEFLDKLAVMIGRYGCHQIESGAQVVQVFESWAHQLSPSTFKQYAKPAAQKAIRIMKEKYPHVPVIYFANGGSSFLDLQRDMGSDMIALDWAVDMEQARKILGPDVAVSGNVDPTILFGSKEQIEHAVRDCIDKAGGPGKHLLNLGHGVMQGTPEEAVGWLVDECKRYRGKAT